MVLPCFVFLKQKTSYEMRISDWSSDVCSSDLAAFFGRGGYVAGIAALHAFEGSAFLAWPVEIGGSESMLVIWLLAMAASAVVALAIGAVSLRTTGVYFIMITLAFAQMIYYFAVSLPTYGGEDGLSIYLRSALPLRSEEHTSELQSLLRL